MKKKNQKILALFAFGSAFILWGINTSFIKIGVENMPSEFYLFIRFLIASIILIPLLDKKRKRIKSTQWPRIFIGTLIGFVITMLLMNEGLKRTNALNTSLIFLLGPAIMYVLSVKVLKEKFNGKILFGLLISLCGAVLIILAPLVHTNGSDHSGSVTGNLIVLSSVIVAVIGTIIIKPALKSIKPLQMTVARFNISVVILLPFCIKDIEAIKAITWTPELIGAMFYSTIFATVIAYSVYHYGLSKISGEESSVLQYLDPLAGVLGAMLILGDRLTPIILLGGGLTILGIYLGEVKTKHRLHILHTHR